jgi:hypothetical protein
MRTAGLEPAGEKRSRSATERQAGQSILRRDDWRPAMRHLLDAEPLDDDEPPPSAKI